MTLEDKELLLKDLCARLPYGVKGLVTFNRNFSMAPNQVEIRTIDSKLYDRFARFQDSWYDNVTIKPYLFPLSSMTEKQKEEIGNLGWNFDNFEIHNVSECIGNYREFVTHSDCFVLIDWLNKNHFDYRGLIPIGLAINATGLNIY